MDLSLLTAFFIFASENMRLFFAKQDLAKIVEETFNRV